MRKVKLIRLDTTEYSWMWVPEYPRDYLGLVKNDDQYVNFLDDIDPGVEVERFLTILKGMNCVLSHSLFQMDLDDQNLILMNQEYDWESEPVEIITPVRFTRYIPRERVTLYPLERFLSYAIQLSLILDRRGMSNAEKTVNTLLQNQYEMRAKSDRWSNMSSRKPKLIALKDSPKGFSFGDVSLYDALVFPWTSSDGLANPLLPGTTEAWAIARGNTSVGGDVPRRVFEDFQANGLKQRHYVDHRFDEIDKLLSFER